MESWGGWIEILQTKTAFTVGLDASEIAQDVLEAGQLVYSDFLPKVSVVTFYRVSLLVFWRPWLLLPSWLFVKSRGCEHREHFFG